MRKLLIGASAVFLSLAFSSPASAQLSALNNTLSLKGVSEEVQAECAKGIGISRCATTVKPQGCPSGKHWSLQGNNKAHCVLDTASCGVGYNQVTDFLGNPSCQAIPIIRADAPPPPPPPAKTPVPPIDPSTAYVDGWTATGNTCDTGGCAGPSTDTGIMAVNVFFRGTPNWTSAYSYQQMLDAAYNTWTNPTQNEYGMKFNGNSSYPWNLVYTNLQEQDFYLVKRTDWNTHPYYFLGSQTQFAAVAFNTPGVEPRHDGGYLNGQAVPYGDAYIMVVKPLCSDLAAAIALANAPYSPFTYNPTVPDQPCTDSYHPLDPKYGAAPPSLVHGYF